MNEYIKYKNECILNHIISLESDVCFRNNGNAPSTIE